MKILGRLIRLLVILFMLFDGVTKIIQEPHVTKAMAELAWPAELTVTLGIILLACTILYAAPRTSVLGAILLTAWLGGATAEKLRLEQHSVWFSVVFGALVWAGLYLSDDRLRALIPLVRKKG